MGLLGGGQPWKTLQAVHDHVAQGLRRRPFHQRHICRRRHPLLPRIHRAPRHRPYPFDFAYRPGRLRVGRQIHDPQPRAVLVERGVREVQLRRCHRPHAHPHGRPPAQTVDRHARQGYRADQRTAGRSRTFRRGCRPGRHRARAGGAGGRHGAYRVAYRRGAGDAPGTGAAQEFALCGRIAQGDCMRWRRRST